MQENTTNALMQPCLPTTQYSWTHNICCVWSGPSQIVFRSYFLGREEIPSFGKLCHNSTKLCALLLKSDESDLNYVKVAICVDTSA